MCVHFSTLIIWESHFKVQTSFEAQNFVPLLSLSLHSFSLTFKFFSMASYGGELLLDSSSPWSGVYNHLSPSPFRCHDLQEAKDSIDEEDPRPTSFTWSYVTCCGCSSCMAKFPISPTISILGQYQSFSLPTTLPTKNAQSSTKAIPKSATKSTRSTSKTKHHP